MPLLRTSFKLLTLHGSAAIWALCTTVTGRVLVESPAKHSRSDSDVVVWLDSSSAPAPQQPEHVRLVQKDKTFRPHVLVVRTGTIVDFPNEDPIFHNAFSTFEGQVFDVGLYPPGTNRSIQFRRAGIVRVFCNIHPSMSAVIIVVDTPYFTKTAPAGEYRFTNVPVGEYRVNVYDERATGKQQVQAAIKIESDEPELRAPVIRVSEAGYAPLPHKNKYGRDYPPGSDNPSYGIMR